MANANVGEVSVNDTQKMRPIAAPARVKGAEQEEPPESLTMPNLPECDADEPEANIIARGHARAALAEALSHLRVAHARLEALADAMARALDEGASK